MKLTNAKYNIKIDMKENAVDVLVLEHPAIMTNIVKGLQCQCDGEEGDFVLSTDDKVLKIDKEMSLVINPFSINLNDKKIISKLYAELRNIGNEFFEEKEEVNAKIVGLLDNIIATTMHNNIIYNLELDLDGLFKLYSVKLESEAETLLENLIDYIKTLSILCSVKVICFVNIRSYLSENEMLQLYEMAFYHKIQILVIDFCERNRLKNENIYIIDKDRCLIVK